MKTAFQTDSEFFKRLNNIIKEKSLLLNSKKLAKYQSLVGYYKPPSKRDNRIILNDALHPGDKIMDTINLYLNKLHRSPQQKVFHKSMLASFLRIIYRDDFDSQKHRVTVKYGFESRKQQVIICSPRRSGKSFSTAYMAVVIAIVMSGIEISIFSPGKRQSVALMGIIADFMDKLGEGDRIIQRNEEKMRVRSLDGGSSKVNAYPSAVRTLKGVSGTICILEEMAQIPPEVLYEVIIPLHQIDITSIICISTITSEDNFMTRYLNQKDSHGESLFACKHIHLACLECREAGIAHKCNHNKHMLPAWSSERKRLIINSIMKEQEEMLAREIGGVASSKHQRAFPKRFLDRFINLPPVNLGYEQTYDFMFHSIDPAAAGTSSELAITTIVRHFGQYVIIGIESFPGKTARDNQSVILDHVYKIRQDIRFENTLSVFILESNLGMESCHIADALEENLGNYLVMNERDDGRHTGFRTTQPMKTIAVEALREQFMNDAVRILPNDEIFSVTRSGADVKGMLIDQLGEFREILRENNASHTTSKSYSGKGTGKDDIVMSLLLNIHWSGYFYKSSKYYNYHR